MKNPIKRLYSGWLPLALKFAALSLIIFSTLIAAVKLQQPAASAAASVGAISGKVFQDYNGNGVFNNSGGLTSVDSGIAGVTVTVYNSAGASVGGDVTDSNGAYSVSTTGAAGAFRVEFTDLPVGFKPSARSFDSVPGGAASNSGSTMQFVPDGGAANINLAINRPEEYCQDNPVVATARFAEGAQNGTYANSGVLLDFSYNSGTSYADTNTANYDSPATHALNVAANKVGTIFSLAYARSTNRIYAASFFKRHAGFGPGADGVFNNADDAGAIYVVNPATNAVVSTLTVPNATTNSHNTADYGNDNNDAGLNAVGRTSLGGVALSDDDQYLFVMNLENRTLYRRDLTANTWSSQAVPTGNLKNSDGSAVSCAASDVRPFAVKYYRGKVYVGIVCSAQSTRTAGNPNGTASNLRALIYEVDPSTLAFGSQAVFSLPLNYTRGVANPGSPNWSANWQPWRSTVTADLAAPQPVLTDIVFDNGNLILGLRDRAGDQSFDNGPNAKRTAGDTLRACGSFGAWTIESNGRCGGAGNAPQNSAQGVGSGEFYFNDDFCTAPGNNGNYHDEVSWGALLLVPGRQHVLTTVLDPISRTISDATFDGGVRWFNNTTGAATRAYRLYNGSGGANVPDFGKTNGMGAMTALCAAPPIEIGNRVWLDSNDNGIQDAGEAGIANVVIGLYKNNALVAATTTDANGEFYFTGSGISPNTTYELRLDKTQTPLNNLTLTSADANDGGNFDSRDSDAANSGNNAVITITTGGTGSNDHTLDFGFKPLAPTAAHVMVAGRVITGDGRGIRNVLVTLTDRNGATRTVLTGVFGYYRFADVTAGQSVIVSIASKRFIFEPPAQIVDVNEKTDSVNFMAVDKKANLKAEKAAFKNDEHF